MRIHEEHIRHDQNTFLYDMGFGTVDVSSIMIFFDGGIFTGNPAYEQQAKEILKDMYHKNAFFLIAANIGELFSMSDPALAKCDSLIQRIELQLSQ